MTTTKHKPLSETAAARDSKGDQQQTQPPAKESALRVAADESSSLLVRVAALLDADQPRQALDLLNRSKQQGDEVLNAQAVCQLRLGKFEQAMELLRGRVIASSSVCLRGDVPPPLAVNFATALLLMGNVPGCQSALFEIEDQQHSGVQQLQAAVRNWRKGLSFWEKVRLWLGDVPKRPITLDYAPGVLQ